MKEGDARGFRYHTEKIKAKTQIPAIREEVVEVCPAVFS